MKRIAIDTATDRATVALQNHDLFYSKEQFGVRQHATSLLPMIQELLQQAKMHLQDLDEIVFGCGPGSFTGLRVTCSVAKALAYAYDLPMRAVNSLQVIATSTWELVDDCNVSHVLVMLDARMNEVYWGLFDRQLNTTQLNVSAVSEIYFDISGSFVISGVGFAEYLPLFNIKLQNKLITTYEIYPDATVMLKCADSCELLSIEEAQPLYIRNNVTQGAQRG